MENLGLVKLFEFVVKLGVLELESILLSRDGRVGKHIGRCWWVWTADVGLRKAGIRRSSGSSPLADAEIRRRHVQAEGSIFLLKWHDGTIDDLAQAALAVLSNVAVLGGACPLLCLAVVVGRNLDQAAIGLDGTVAEARVAKRRLLARNDTSTSSDSNMLRGAVVGDEFFDLFLANGWRW